MEILIPLFGGFFIGMYGFLRGDPVWATLMLYAGIALTIVAFQ